MFSRYVVGPDGCSSRLWASGASRCRLVCHLSKWQAVRLLCLAVLSLAASSMLCFCEVAMGQVMGIVIGAFSQACSSYCGCQAMSRAFHLDSRVLSCDHWPIYCPVRSGTMWSTCNAGLVSLGNTTVVCRLPGDRELTSASSYLKKIQPLEGSARPAGEFAAGG